MVVIAAIGVALAIFVVAPPLAVVLLVSAVPALFVTEFKTYRRRRRGEPVSGWQRLVWFLGFTILIPIVLVALAICLIGLCIAFNR
jgi:sterol desaturase/sphingolipid hydroxylase (fatty acid hydroxylase superfamily)